MTPLISVVMPCYNGITTLAEAVQSIQTQSQDGGNPESGDSPVSARTSLRLVQSPSSDWELILFDDGSTDGSLELAQDIAQVDPRIHIMASDHVGIVVGLQQACAEARGTYIARMDADDVAHPQRLAKQLALLEADPDIALCGTLVRMTGGDVGLGRRRYERWINRLVTHDDIVRELFVECPIAHPTFMMRRDAYEAVGGYQEHGWAEDHDLFMRFFQAGYRFGKVDEVLLDWRESPDRLSMTSDRYSPTQFRALKRHYLFQTYLKNNRPFHQWGAGRVGKPWLREWDERHPEAVVDINPRKIGIKIHGYPIIAPDQLPPPGDTFIVITVGAPGARADIRDWLNPRGYHETKDYIFLA